MRKEAARPHMSASSLPLSLLLSAFHLQALKHLSGSGFAIDLGAFLLINAASSNRLHENNRENLVGQISTCCYYSSTGQLSSSLAIENSQTALFDASRRQHAEQLSVTPIPSYETLVSGIHTQQLSTEKRMTARNYLCKQTN
ncbi:unnamed protein product [Nippostrongylus brasiliensis]|uniref:Secreted protein n=1 Tax=Nippostrongylus brasiliensis TaxID=27835 RepID=A0A0N4Y3E9_NIPBR|nr:unnamed protein product [Nippostrongylus brasiliensis]